MKTVPPVHASDLELFARVSEAMAGGALTAVRYLISAGTAWPSDRLTKQVHEIDHGIELETGPGAIVSLCWATEGVNEGLSLEVRADRREGSEDDLVIAVNVSDLQEFHPFLGNVLRLKGRASHVPFGTDQAFVWAVRFESVDSQLVIALGELDGMRLGYMPDNLLAIFDSGIAWRFTIPDSPSSAWGTDI